MSPAIRRALVALTCTATGLTACSSAISGHGSGGPPAPAPASSGPAFPSSTPAATLAPSTTATTGPGGGDNAALSAPDLAQATKSAMTSATAFRMTGSGTDSSQTQIGFDIHYGESSSSGTLTLDGQRVDLLNSGPDIYMKADRQFWERVSGGANDTVVQILAGKWVHVPATSPGLAELAAIADREKFLANVASSPDTGGYTTGPAKTVNGVPSVSFVSGDDGSVIYVPATGTPFPIRIESHGDSPGSFDLGQWNVPFTADPPPADQIVELPG